MMWIITTVAGWILRQSSTGFLREIGDYLKKSEDGQTAVALKQIDAEIEARKAARDVRLATAGFWEMRLITFCIAGTFTLHLVAVGLDTVFSIGWGIPKFPAPFDEWEGAILLSFFGVQGAAMVVSGVVAAVVKRRS